LPPESLSLGTATDVAFRLLVESVQDYAIFLLDPGGYIITWNRGAQRAKGYTAEEIIGKHFSIFYTEPDIRRNHPAYELRVALKDGRYEEEGWRVRKDGTEFWANVVITAVFDDAGRHIGFGKVTRDLTERKRREEREMSLQQERARADASNKAKTDFLTTMSHELRTPLNAIVGYVDLLDAGVHGTLNAAQRDTIHRVRRSSHVLLGLINDVLNIARIEAGHVIYRMDTFTLETLIRDLETLMSAQYANAGLDLKFEVDGDVAVTADYDKTQQIFLNLLSNSLKFTEPGGTVSVQAFAGEEFATIRVADTGRGIPKAQLEEIFEPFVQVDRTSTPESQQGVGLGLAISRDLARGMGGDIVAESEVDRGATFTVTLPFAGQPADGSDA
jgi:PAS domain S-box-containing protein